MACYSCGATVCHTAVTACVCATTRRDAVDNDLSEGQSKSRIRAFSDSPGHLAASYDMQNQKWFCRLSLTNGAVGVSPAKRALRRSPQPVPAIAARRSPMFPA